MEYKYSKYINCKISGDGKNMAALMQNWQQHLFTVVILTTLV